MIYLNGQIGAVYMDGRYHSEVYLGSVLVWQNVKKIPGEALAQLAFENTADGVAVVLLPGVAAGDVQLSPAVTGTPASTVAPEAASKIQTGTTVTPTAHGADSSEADQGLRLLTEAQGIPHNVENGEGRQKIALDIESSGEANDLRPGERKIDIVLNCPQPPADSIATKPGDGGVSLDFATPEIPAIGVIVEKDKLDLEVGLAETAEAAPVNTLNGSVAGKAALASEVETGEGELLEGVAAGEAALAVTVQPGEVNTREGTPEGAVQVTTTVHPDTTAAASGTPDGKLSFDAESTGTAAEAVTEAPVENIAITTVVNGKAVGWLDPAQYGALLVVKQVYSATVKQDGVLGNILEVT